MPNNIKNDLNEVPIEELRTMVLLLQNKDTEVRDEALDSLCDVAFMHDISEEIIGLVLEVIDRVELTSMREIIRQLPCLLNGITWPIINLLANSTEEVRYAAADALHDLCLDPYDLEEIAQLLHHSNGAVRFSVAEFLEAEGQEHLIPAGYNF